MMKKKGIYVLLLLFVSSGLVAVLVVGAFREREPEYGGKRLSEWVRRFAIFDLRLDTGGLL